MGEKISTRFLVKGDVSGIQEFIFNIPGKKAAKTLKSKSEEVKYFAHSALKTLHTKFTCSNIYNGGGNFFVIVNTKEQEIETNIDETEIEINNNAPHGLYLSLSYCKWDENKSGECWQQVNIKSNVAKLKKYKQIDYFEPCFLTRIATKEYKENMPLWPDTITINNFYADKNSERPGVNSIVNFEDLAGFAANRGKKELLGVLKLDVDNLGRIFKEIESEKGIRSLSKQFSDFFDVTVFNIIKTQTDAVTPLDSNQMNLYPVFVGGDDCFILGAWDKVIDFILVFRKEFNLFSQKILADYKHNVSVSAAFELVAPHFPVVKLAELAENNLLKAKSRTIGGEIVKNSIAFLGEVLTWDEFKKVTLNYQKLMELVQEDPSAKVLIHRIQEAAVEFEILQNAAIEHKIKLPRVWKLYYHLRNVKNQQTRERIQKLVIRDYEEALINAFSRKITTNPVVFPLAARLTELSI